MLARQACLAARRTTIPHWASADHRGVRARCSRRISLSLDEANQSRPDADIADIVLVISGTIKLQRRLKSFPPTDLLSIAVGVPAYRSNLLDADYTLRWRSAAANMQCNPLVISRLLSAYNSVIVWTRKS